MGVKISLAENGYILPVAFGSSVLKATGTTQGLAANSSYVITDDGTPANTIFTLPTPPVGQEENYGGNLILLKVNTTTPVNITLSVTSPEKIDGTAGETIVIDENKTSILLYYVYDYGWVTGPSNF